MNMAIYIHIYSIYAPKRFAQWLYSAFTARKLVCAILSQHNYGVAMLNLHKEG